MDNWSIGHKVVEAISNCLEDGKQILELGSGVGTSELIKKWKVKSVEENTRFLNLFHYDYIYAPVVDEWYDVSSLNVLKNFEWDLLLIDGPAGGKRSNMIKNLDIFKFKIGQIIVADDVERPDDLAALNELEQKLAESFRVEREDFESFSTKRFSIMRIYER
jgi:hypothetical protein